MLLKTVTREVEEIINLVTGKSRTGTQLFPVVAQVLKELQIHFACFGIGHSETKIHEQPTGRICDFSSRHPTQAEGPKLGRID